MKRINLAQALEQCADDAVLQRIADQMGLPPHVVAHVLRSAGPVLVAALTVRAAHGCEDTQAVFDALMSRDSNARIGSECAHLVETTAGLKDFEHRGHVLATRATDIPVAALSDHIAVRTGVPTQPASVLCSIAAAMLAGLIKHHVLLEQGDVTAIVRERVALGEMFPGFGHGVYRKGGPRAYALLDRLARAGADKRFTQEIPEAIAEAAGVSANIDYALAVLMRTLDLPPAHELVLFAMSRTAGWILTPGTLSPLTTRSSAVLAAVTNCSTGGTLAGATKMASGMNHVTSCTTCSRYSWLPNFSASAIP